MFPSVKDTRRQAIRKAKEVKKAKKPNKLIAFPPLISHQKGKRTFIRKKVTFGKPSIRIYTKGSKSRQMEIIQGAPVKKRRISKYSHGIIPICLFKTFGKRYHPKEDLFKWNPYNAPVKANGCCEISHDDERNVRRRLFE